VEFWPEPYKAPGHRAHLVERIEGFGDIVMNAVIAPLAEAHFDELRAVLDVVARERRYLAALEASPPERSFAFYRSLIADGQGHVALVDGRVVGWCDIQSTFGQARAHVGILGIGLLPDARGHGIGTRLLQSAIATAWSRGLTRIELTVRDDNTTARALYERLGFEHEGIQRRSMRVDGHYYDCFAMALLRRDDA